MFLLGGVRMKKSMLFLCLGLLNLFSLLLTKIMRSENRGMRSLRIS